MEQGVTAVIMTMLIVLVFIPAIYLGALQANREKVNDAMYLASRCLEDCVLSQDEYSLEEIAQGYALSEDPIMRVRIDEGKLFTQFDYVLYKNIGNIEEYSKVANNILCKILVYPDRYVVWDDVATASFFYEDSDVDHAHDSVKNGYYYYSYDEEYDEVKAGIKDVSVSAPKYFVYKNVDEFGDDKAELLRRVGDTTDPGHYFYINAINDKVRRFGDQRSWRNIDTFINQYESGFSHQLRLDEGSTSANYELNKKISKPAEPRQLSTYDKNQVIIETLNKEIAYYTGGVKMDFINPASTVEKNIKATKKDFNFFEGISLIVIYRQPQFFNVSNTMFNFSQYTAAGYTLEN